MLRTVRTVLLGAMALAAISTGNAVQGQVTIDPIFYGGVVGDPVLRDLLTTQGAVWTFTSPRPSIASLSSSTLWTGSKFQVIRSPADSDNNLTTLQIRRGAPEYTAPSFEFSTLEYRDGTTVVGTGDVFAIIFATAPHRDAFVYYLQQREAATTEIDFNYFNTLASYEFWMGQENISLALYTYYTGLATYYRDTTADPNQGMYYYYYYVGLGAYYYFEGIGDSDSAWLAFVYHLQLANQALNA